MVVCAENLQVRVIQTIVHRLDPPPHRPPLPSADGDNVVEDEDFKVRLTTHRALPTECLDGGVSVRQAPPLRVRVDGDIIPSLRTLRQVLRVFAPDSAAGGCRGGTVPGAPGDTPSRDWLSQPMYSILLSR